MKLLVCGSRGWTNIDGMRRIFDQLTDVTIVVHGDSRGADRLAGTIAKERGYATHVFPAQWHKYGKRAGPYRNAQMLTITKPDMVLAFRLPGYSPGTDDMIWLVKRAGIQMRVLGPKR